MTDQDEARYASERIAGQLRAEIEAGEYSPGSRLPSIRQLQEDHQVARNTAQAAIRILAAEGLVETKAASGSFVRDRTSDPVDVRAELIELRSRLRQAHEDLGAVEHAVADLVTRLGDEAPRR